MQYDYLVFDLDGTLTDPKEGFVKSINFALTYFGFENLSESELTSYIGPPLDHTFKGITKSDDSTLIESLIKKYRERYSDVGYAENVIYTGIPETLEKLFLLPDTRLGVCTSKRGDFAERILEKFGLRHFFDFVSGGDVGIEKSQQLQALIDTQSISINSLMIGDRYVDVTAAQKNNLHSAGVLWGYGSRSELEKNSPNYLFSAPDELVKLTIK